MKKLMLSTALVAAAATAASAQDASTTFRTTADPLEIHASNFIGKRVYASEAQLEADAYEGAQTDWEDIGEINDVILSRSGEVEAVLVDIGGFLGIGERQVAVDMSAIKFVADSATPEDESDFFLVMNANRAAFEDAPEYSWTETSETDLTAQAQADQPVAADDNGTEMAAGSATAPDGDITATGNANNTDVAASSEAAEQPMAGGDTMMSRDGYVSAPQEELTAEMLTGAPVYDKNDEWIGEVSEIVLTEQGQVDGTVIDVGGFLGIGEKPVELALGDLQILREDGGDDVRVYVAMSEDQLKAMPTYEK